VIVIDASVVVNGSHPSPATWRPKPSLAASWSRRLFCVSRSRLPWSRKASGGELAPDDLKVALDLWFGGLAEGHITLIPDDDDLSEACAIAFELRHPVPDCLYLAAARRLNLPLITADRAFAGRAATKYSSVQMLVDDQP
jgi:predicted nucleic acid-binding protein